MTQNEKTNEVPEKGQRALTERELIEKAAAQEQNNKLINLKVEKIAALNEEEEWVAQSYLSVKAGNDRLRDDIHAAKSVAELEKIMVNLRRNF